MPAPNDSNSLIQIKGLRDGLLVTLSAAPWEELQAALMEQIAEKQSFFQGARLALDVGGQIFHVNELSALRDSLSERGVTLWAVVSESPTTEQTAQLLGLATRISKPRPTEVTREAAMEEGEGPSAQWIGRTLRSGTRIEFHGNVTVMGDINPGAEVVAGGSVVVWGRVRGLVHAGSKNPAAVICALEFASTQIRIGEQVVDLPERLKVARPEKIFLEDGRPRVEPWQAD
jgi:septum site-determining protein MinC